MRSIRNFQVLYKALCCYCTLVSAALIALLTSNYRSSRLCFPAVSLHSMLAAHSSSAWVEIACSKCSSASVPSPSSYFLFLCFCLSACLVLCLSVCLSVSLPVFRHMSRPAPHLIVSGKSGPARLFVALSRKEASSRYALGIEFVTFHRLMRTLIKCRRYLGFVQVLQLCPWRNCHCLQLISRALLGLNA